MHFINVLWSKFVLALPVVKPRVFWGRLFLAEDHSLAFKSCFGLNAIFNKFFLFAFPEVIADWTQVFYIAVVVFLRTFRKILFLAIAMIIIFLFHLWNLKSIFTVSFCFWWDCLNKADLKRNLFMVLGNFLCNRYIFRLYRGTNWIFFLLHLFS